VRIHTARSDYVDVAPKYNRNADVVCKEMSVHVWFVSMDENNFFYFPENGLKILRNIGSTKEHNETH
jgi:hypothetical protein